MFSRLLAKITGADKKKKYPDQQAEIMGRVGDYIVVFPYGLYCDLPGDALAEEIKHGMLIPITVIRPDDVEQGEPVFYHPVTNTRIIPRNDGSLDIIANGQAVNIQCDNANVNADANINLTAPLTTIAGDLTVTGNTTLGATVTSNGKDISDTHVHNGSPTSPAGPVSPTGVPI